MPQLFATVLRYNTQAKQADSITTRKSVVENALKAANDFVLKKMAAPSDKRRQIWGLFAAPEYMFANVLTHGDHTVGDVRHLSEAAKAAIEGWLKGLSTQYPHQLLMPGSIAWKKPAKRDLGQYIANKQLAGSKLKDADLKKRFEGKTMTRTEKAQAAVRQNASDFLYGGLDYGVSNPLHDPQPDYRGWKLNPLPKGPDDLFWFETDDPSGVLDGGKRWTLDAKKAAPVYKVLRQASSSRDKLHELGGGQVTELARNTCLVYLNGRRVAKYNKANDFHEVLDAGHTVYIPGKSVPVFDVDGVKYGVEICLDHAFGAAAERLPSTAKPDICVVLSARVELNPAKLANPNAMVVHACSKDADCMVGLGGVPGQGATLEHEAADYRIYSFTV